MDATKKGALFVLVAATSYACMSAIVKVGAGLTVNQFVFMRNFVCLLVILPTLFMSKEKVLRTAVFPTHVVRACAGLLNMYCFFYSVHYILLSDAVLLSNTMPLFIPLVMWVWHHKKFKKALLPGLILGFLGVLLILHPGRALFHPAAFLALASGLFMAISFAGIRELTKTETISSILFYYFAISTALSLVPFVITWKMPSLLGWELLVSVGLFAAIYQYFVTKGYENASPSKISPLIYFAVVLSAFFDWIFWKYPPNLLTFAGLVLVVVGAIFCVRKDVHA